jgi:hypothetical protein
MVPAKLFLGFRKRTIGQNRFAVLDPYGGRGGCRLKLTTPREAGHS